MSENYNSMQMLLENHVIMYFLPFPYGSPYVVTFSHCILFKSYRDIKCSQKDLIKRMT